MADPSPRPFKAVVIGGSLGGLFTGNMLRAIGWDVDIYERSPRDLDSRGGGIVLQQDVIRLIHRVGTNIGQDLGVPSWDRITYYPDGRIRSRDFAPQSQTSWGLIYTILRNHFGPAHYHAGKTLIDIQRQTGQVTAIFDDGTTDTGDLLIGADGIRSTVRSLVEPDNYPKYAGYIAWRGLVPEAEIPAVAQDLLGHFAFANNRQSHMLGYLVPGDHHVIEEGKHYYNWVWYRTADENHELPAIMTDHQGKTWEFSIPPGKLSDSWRQHLQDEAAELLPPPFRAVVQATQEPFAQAIVDLTSQHMVYDRVVLIGDAAFVPRPHTAASTAKAAANVLALGETLKDIRSADRIDQVLRAWEPTQLRLGQYLHKQGSKTGDQLLFHSEVCD